MSVLPEPKDAPKLRYIHFSVTGTNHVAHRTVFKQPGINITTSAGAPAPAVAEWVIGSILTHSRSFPLFQQFQKESTWGRLALPAPGDLVGKKMAILGYGSIGRQGTSSRSCSSHFEDEMLIVPSYANYDDLADAQQSGALRRRWGWRSSPSLGLPAQPRTVDEIETFMLQALVTLMAPSPPPGSKVSQSLNCIISLGRTWTSWSWPFH